MRIERTHPGSDARMIASAKEKKQIFNKHYEAFLAFNRRFENPMFTIKWQQAIEAAEQVQKDKAVRSKLKKNASMLKAIMKQCKMKWRQIKFAVEKTYPNNSEKLNEFGLEDYAKASKGRTKMIAFMKELHTLTQKHAADLTKPENGGLSQAQIDEIDILRGELSEGVKQQNIVKRGRTALSNNRVKILNDCYQFEADVNEAGKILFQDEPDMFRLFVYRTKPDTEKGGTIINMIGNA